MSYDPILVFDGYGPGIAACQRCKAIWEAFDDSDVWDDDDALCSFRKPCNNCAFRKGSPERSNPETWAQLMVNVEGHGGFFCHKGVPIEPGAEHGFAYPEKITTSKVDGKTIKMTVPDRQRHRYCRGWLNAAFSAKNMAKYEA